MTWVASGLAALVLFQAWKRLLEIYPRISIGFNFGKAVIHVPGEVLFPNAVFSRREGCQSFLPLFFLFQVELSLKLGEFTGDGFIGHPEVHA